MGGWVDECVGVNLYVLVDMEVCAHREREREREGARERVYGLGYTCVCMYIYRSIDT